MYRDDKLLYSFTLRDGLKFHDGQPVRGVDCTTSMTRWMARDSFGQTLAAESPRSKAATTRPFRSGSRSPLRC